jgi:multiple antibiotic resistance protein
MSMGMMLLRHFMTLWATIDPIGSLALFVGLTASLSRADRRRVAARSIIYAAVILVVTVVIGQFVLDAIGIHLLSLKLAGGLILFVLSLKMLFGDMDTTAAVDDPGRDIAIFPLAVPSIAGPGAITAAIVLTDNDVYTVPEQTLTAVMLLAVLLITYVMFLLSEQVLRVIGRSGASILVRIMGIILAALSVELVMGALGIGVWANVKH